MQGVFKRQNTNQWEWDAARSVARSHEDAGSWTGTAPQPAPPAPENTPAQRPTIENAATRYKAEFSEHAAFATQKKYRLMLDKQRVR